MDQTGGRLPSLLERLRWVIPALISALGVAYTVVEHLLIASHAVPAPHVLREALIIGTVGPALAWLLLSWATRIARSQQQAEQALARLNRQRVAILMENARLIQETRQRFQAMTALHETSLDIVSRQNNGQVLQAILQRAADLLRAQGGSLGILEPETGLVRKIAVHNLAKKYQGITLSLGEGVAGKVVATGEPLIVNDYPEWAGRSDRFTDGPYDAVIGVPLRWQGEVIGCLDVLDQGERRPFSEEDISLLSSFADLAAIAIKNAELHEQVVQLGEQLERKVEQRTRELAQAREALAQKTEQLQRLLAATVSIQEEERVRIARDLHDGSNQLITGTLYEIQAAQESILGQRDEDAVKKLGMVKQLLRKIEAENRRIIAGLRPPILDTQGLVPALKGLAHTTQERYRIGCSVQVSGEPVRLSPEAVTAIYRIVQESLNNVIAHAGAESVSIRVDFGPTQLRLVVEDDGVGFDVESVLAAPPGQMGLIGMRERAESIGGRLEVWSRSGYGTRIALDLPLAHQQLPEAVAM